MIPAYADGIEPPTQSLRPLLYLTELHTRDLFTGPRNPVTIAFQQATILHSDHTQIHNYLLKRVWCVEDSNLIARREVLDQLNKGPFPYSRIRTGFPSQGITPNLAGSVRFELTEPFQTRRFSRPVQ